MKIIQLVKKVISVIVSRSQWAVALSLILTAVYSYAAPPLIVVQNGRGLVGVIGETLSPSFSGRTLNPVGNNGGVYNVPWSYVYLAFYDDYSLCNPSLLMNIDGVTGIKFNSQGTLMLVPEVTYTDRRSWSGGSDTVTATFNGYGSSTNQNLGVNPSCIWQPNQSTPPSSTDASLSVLHSVTATGRILIYGTGQQTSSTGFLSQPLKMILRNPRSPGPHPQGVLVGAGSYPVMVSDLGCTITTPTLIDFGPQPANAADNQLLATRVTNLSVNCQQATNPIAATIALVAGVKPAYYSGNSHQANLLSNSGVAAAYVTMSMNINGSDVYIPFDRKFVDIGAITTAQSAKSFDFPVTYRLFSKGAGVAGKIRGSAELSIVLR